MQHANSGLSFHPRHCRLQVVKGMLPCLLVLQPCRRPDAHLILNSMQCTHVCLCVCVCVGVFSSVCACSSHLHWGMPFEEQQFCAKMGPVPSCRSVIGVAGLVPQHTMKA